MKVYLPAILPTDREGKEIELVKSPVSFISDKAWSRIQANGDAASEKLSDMIASPNFEKWKRHEQLAIIKLATDMAYKVSAPTQAITIVHQTERNPEEAMEMNALRSVAVRAISLPEYARSPDKQSRN